MLFDALFLTPICLQTYFSSPTKPCNPFITTSSSLLSSSAGPVNFWLHMTLRDFSKPGSWASRLYDILRPAPHPMAVQFSNSQSRFRHSTGEIWRHALSCSVYHDLLGDRDTNKNIAPTNRACRRRTWRRFVRIECIGLSGLLFYEIRAPASSVCDSPRIHEGRPILTGNEQCKYDLTVENVFGDPDDPDDAGMEVDDLLDAVHARVVYFPAYACTSFIVCI